MPLVGVLIGAAFAELVFNRLWARLLRPELLLSRSGWGPALDLIGLFTFELLTTLSVLMLAVALARMVMFGARYRAGARLSFALVGGVCVLLAGSGAFVRLSNEGLFHLHLSFTFLAVLICVAAFAAETELRLKLGMLLLLPPLALHFASSLARRLETTPGGALPAELALASEWALLAAALSTVVCFAPRGGRWRAPALLAVFVGAASAVLIHYDWESAARIAAYGFGIELPLSPWALDACLVAIFAFAFTLFSLLPRSGVDRLRAYGLVLLGVCGLQLELPCQVACASIGLLCLLESLVRPAPEALTREQFDLLVRRGAAAVGAPQVTVTGPDGFERARWHSPATASAKVAVTLARRAGVVRDVEVVVGDVSPRSPTVSVRRRGSPRLGPLAAGPVTHTADELFDRAFTVQDHRGAATSLLDDQTRARMATQLHGWLGIWPQHGLCYRARQLPPGDDGLPSLIQFLQELAGRT